MKDPAKLARQMTQRGWTPLKIDEAVRLGAAYPVVNRETGGRATRYVHPETGRSVVIDATGDIIHVGGDGFRY